MTAVALRDNRRPVFAGITGNANESPAAGTGGYEAVPVDLLPECTCFHGDCDRDHDNE